MNGEHWSGRPSHEERHEADLERQDEHVRRVWAEARFMTRTFTIPGQPQGQPRARHGSPNGGRPSTWATDKQRTFERRVAMAYQAAGAPAPLEGPLVVEIDALFRCPKTDERKREPRTLRWRAGRPDADNVAKAVCDALNGLAYEDDAQVVDLRVRTMTAPQGEEPRVVVRISPTAGGPSLCGDLG
jgi:Holliday junction resolvase RusA-like endonuclease